MSRNFDAGAEVQKAGGKNFAQAKKGSHTAMLSGIIHLGQFQDIYKGEKKPLANFVAAVFTLLGKSDVNEDGTRIQTVKVFPLKAGDKATMTKVLDAVDPEEASSGWDDVIGNVASVNMKGNGKTDDDGVEYTNFGGISAPVEEVVEMAMAKIEKEGLETIGHIRFDEMTKEAIRALPPFIIRTYLLGEGNGESLSYSGSKAEEIINAIREEEPDFAKSHSDKEDQEEEEQEPQKPSSSVPAEVPTNLTDDEDLDGDDI